EDLVVLVVTDTEVGEPFDFADGVERWQVNPRAGYGVQQLDVFAPYVRGHQPPVVAADPSPVLESLGLAEKGLAAAAAAGRHVVQAECARLDAVLGIVAV
uniref:Uncharacterized protein n=1 Tax=Zea mays TaxID=4577 RepID=A0A804M984_MAIZE